MKKTTYILAILSIVFATACAVEDPDDDHSDHAEHPEEEVNNEEVHMVQRQMDVMGIELGQFQSLNLSTTVKSNGKLELPPQNKASLSAVMGGRVKSILVLEGDYVKKGQTLATLEHPDFIEMQQQYMEANSALAFLDADYKRKKRLFEDSVTSEKAFQQAQAKYKGALAVSNGLKAKMKMLNMDLFLVERGDFATSIPVKSPINGYVRLIEINMGSYVEPQQEMFEIVDNEHIHIDLMVYEKDMDKVKKGQKVIFSLVSNSDSVFQGTIFAVGKSFEEESKALLVHAEIDNKATDSSGNMHFAHSGLLPGMYVDARIVTNNETVRALPNDAIVSDGGLSYIFVLKPASVHNHAEGDDHDHPADAHAGEFVFRKIEVSLGATDIGFTEVVPAYNLPDHVEIVTKGAFYLLAEMKKGEGGHGHHH